MCTSSSTTSGSAGGIRLTASVTVPASPTTSTYAPSSARTPARNIAWSSTRNTLNRRVGSVIVVLTLSRPVAGCVGGGRRLGDRLAAVGGPDAAEPVADLAGTARL